MVGPITFADISLAEITNIEKTNTWISSPACSLNRIRVSYGKNGSVVISPEDKERFDKEIIKDCE